ncbi:MAG TPA: nucleotide exchange factor GrpE [Solirubrobacterales bacterium]
MSARQDDQQDKGQGPAGPVAAGDPPPPAVAEASSGVGPPTTPPAGDDGAEVEQDIAALLTDTQRERDEYLDLAKRTKADFENFRKRMLAENQAAIQRGKSELARDLVPVLDSLERALRLAGIEVVESADNEAAGATEQGLLLIFRNLHQVLKQTGIEVVDPKGERFDPNLHEALSTVAADGTESGTVVETMQKGYRLGEQLIRPARVVVAE